MLLKDVVIAEVQARTPVNKRERDAIERFLLEIMPAPLPFGLVICSARTFTRDYHDGLASWRQAGVPVWGTVPERVAIDAGPTGWLSLDGLDAYRNAWRRALRAARSS